MIAPNSLPDSSRCCVPKEYASVSSAVRRSTRMRSRSSASTSASSSSQETWIDLRHCSQEFRVSPFPHSLNVSAADSEPVAQIQLDPRYAPFVERAMTKDVLGEPLPVASIEDVLQGKVWARRGRGPTREQAAEGPRRYRATPRSRTRFAEQRATGDPRQASVASRRSRDLPRTGVIRRCEPRITRGVNRRQWASGMSRASDGRGVLS